jgi:hypothetical protein
MTPWLDTLARFFDLLGRSLSLSWSFRLPEALTILEGDPLAPWVVAAAAVLAGASLLAGESIILFVNRVPRSRFLLSLLFNGMAFAVELLVGALAVWAVGNFAFRLDAPFGLVVRAVMLSSAPLVLAFLTFIPYLGPIIARVLYVWWFLILFGAIRYSLAAGVWRAVLVGGVAWLLILIFNRTLGRPVAGLRDWVWERVIGTRPGYARALDLLDDTTGSPAEAVNRVDNLLE